jgi:hypothetical protein
MFINCLSEYFLPSINTKIIVEDLQWRNCERFSRTKPRAYAIAILRRPSVTYAFPYTNPRLCVYTQHTSAQKCCSGNCPHFAQHPPSFCSFVDTALDTIHQSISQSNNHSFTSQTQKYSTRHKQLHQIGPRRNLITDLRFQAQTCQARQGPLLSLR